MCFTFHIYGVVDIRVIEFYIFVEALEPFINFTMIFELKKKKKKPSVVKLGSYFKGV